MARKVKVETAVVEPPKKNTEVIYNEIKKNILNGFQEAILGFSPASIGTELSQVDSVFLNNRWYFISNMRQVLSQSYVEHGLIQSLVDTPVNDAFRGGIEILSKQLSPEQIEQILTVIDRKDILSSVIGRAQKWNRLFGGAGVIIITDQDAFEPLDLSLIDDESELEFRAVDMWELFYDKQNVEGFNPAIEDPKFDYYDYYGKKIHKSRVMKLKGLEAPSFVRPRFRGWGFSVVEGVLQSLNQNLKAKNLAFEVLDEFKIDIFKIKNLSQSLLSPMGESAVRKRVALANSQKNFQHALTMDSEDDYMQKQLNFSGLAEMMKEIRIQIAADFKFPMAKLYGLSAAGFASGEDDIENYNAMVESEVRSKSKYEIVKIIEIISQEQFGYIPDDIKVTFKPLRILGAEQEENVKNSKFNRILAARTAGEITIKEFRDGCNKDNLLSIQLDSDIRDIPMPETDLDEGANKESSQKPKLPNLGESK